MSEFIIALLTAILLLAVVSGGAIVFALIIDVIKDWK